MALQNADGNYIRINKEQVRANLASVPFNTFRDKATREAPTTFDMSPGDVHQVVVSDELLDFAIGKMYVAIKENEPFASYIDV